MKEKLRRVEVDLHELREEMREKEKEFVTHTHFEAVVEPMRRTLDTVQRDVKEILRAVSAPRRSAD